MNNKRKYSLNENIFNTIDSEEKAYWLGFLYADGCVTLNKQSNKYVLSVQLNIKDVEHLNKFKLFLSTNKPITYFTRQSKITNKTHKYCCISVMSNILCKNLIKHGCKPRKSLKLTYPKIPTNLNFHFIRGYFDGDGGWHCRKRKTECIQISAKIVSNKKFLSQINKILALNTTIRWSTKACPQIRQLTIEGNNKTKIFYNLLYGNASIYLERKYNQASQHFSTILNKKSYFIDDVLYEYNQDKKSLLQWSIDNRCAVKLGTLRNRLSRLKWTFEDALLTPTNKRGHSCQFVQ